MLKRNGEKYNRSKKNGYNYIVRLNKIKILTKFKDVIKVWKTLFKWKWAGHILREKKEKCTRIITEWYSRDSKRSKGRQMKR